jgi:hypothetical protein
MWGDFLFWNVLQLKDRGRAIRILLKGVSRGHFDIISAQKLIDQDRDADELLDFAGEELEHAIAVCKCLTMQKKSFWDTAIAIIKLHPESEAIRDALTYYSDVEEGWLLTQDQMKSRCDEVARMQNDPKTPYVAQQWLSQFADYLDERAEAMRRSVI